MGQAQRSGRRREVIRVPCFVNGDVDLTCGTVQRERQMHDQYVAAGDGAVRSPGLLDILDWLAVQSEQSSRRGPGLRGHRY